MSTQTLSDFINEMGEENVIVKFASHDVPIIEENDSNDDPFLGIRFQTGKLELPEWSQRVELPDAQHLTKKEHFEKALDNYVKTFVKFDTGEETPLSSQEKINTLLHLIDEVANTARAYAGEEGLQAIIKERAKKYEQRDS